MIEFISHDRTSLFCLLLTGCMGWSMACTSSKTMKDCPLPEGKYINTTVLSKYPEMMPADLPHFCFELHFKGKDTVELENGFEKFRLKYSESGEGCSYVIHGASLFGDMSFTLDSDSTLMLVDTSWTKLGSPTRFSRAKVENGESIGFETLLNDCIIAEEYALFDHGNLRPGVVTFMANGQINGFKPYLAYAICYAGDCLETTDPASRTIDLIDGKGQTETFVFKSIEGKMAIELYQIGPAIPDIKGGRSIGPMIYELRTE